MKVLFARVGYMKFYKGSQPGDERPIKGGSYNDKKIGSEVHNFTKIKGYIYGYYQPNMKEPYEINLERIEKNNKQDFVENVLVIWFATNPIGKGQVVIGWYKNATVYRAIQEANSLPERDNNNYNIKVKASNAFLLPISRRKYSMGHNLSNVKTGNPGQTNTFYRLMENGEPKDTSDPTNKWIDKVIEYVKIYDGNSISSTDDEVQENITTLSHSLGGQGFQTDVETRLMIEEYSMKACMKYYKKKKYTVSDVSATQPYDILLEKDGVEILVEVKGTQTSGRKIILTKNEVELSKKHGKKMILFIVHSISMNKKSVRKGSGEIKIVRPWKLQSKKLKAISYTYTYTL